MSAILSRPQCVKPEYVWQAIELLPVPIVWADMCSVSLGTSLHTDATEYVQHGG